MNELLGLTARQAAAVGKLAHAPVPPAPALNPALLTAAPLSYQLVGLGGLALKGGLILSLVALPFIKAPEREAPLPAQEQAISGEGIGPAEPAREDALPEAERSQAGEILRTLWHEEE